MPIPESQLETWSHQGSVKQSSATYATVKGALEAPDASYANQSHTRFLQGSYGNDTNIFADSDVDVVMRLDSAFYHDLEDLADDEKHAFKSNFSDASYNHADFKKDVTAQLRKAFGDAVKPGGKAIFVAGNGSRRDADVLVAAQYRKYHSFKSMADQNYVEGICFWNAEGTLPFLNNFPHGHYQHDLCEAL